MKKLSIILIILILRCNCFAFSPLVVCSGVPNAPSGYADIIFYSGLENTGTATIPSGLTPTTTTLLFWTDYALAGSYSAYTDSTSSRRIIWTNTADAILDRDEGRFGFWVRTGTAISAGASIAGCYYDANNYIHLKMYTSTGLSVEWAGQGTTYSKYKLSLLTTETSYFVEVAWSSGGISLYIDGSEVTGMSTSGSFTVMDNTTSDGDFAIGGYSQTANSIGSNASFDQTIISNDSTRDIYAIRTITSF